MKRVMNLYRVSTKSQVDPQDDIPVQRRECMAFIERHPDWVYIGERLEKGVSGYKVSVNDRDALMDLKQMAERNEYDVLLVFMFDRLGRREDETPFLVEWFIKHGIEVWSTREGQQTIENRGDKLMNYIRYWMAGGESEKTSIRVKAAQTQMTEDGLWRGGTCPYGYKLVHNGRVGKKNRQLFDLEIDEFTAPIVQEIFRLYTEEGYGTLRIANYLNEHYPNPEKVWIPQTIRSMLKNQIYTGRMHMNSVQSEPLERLRLISDQTYGFVKECMKRNIQSKFPEQRQSELDEMPIDAKTKASVYGASLLSGLLYCAHCGHRLVGTYCQENRNGVLRHRPVYRDYVNAVQAKNCIGQSVYSARKIEPAIIKIVSSYLRSMTNSIDAAWEKKARQAMRSNNASIVNAASAKLAELKKKQSLLKQEVVKSLTGESAFDAPMLREMIDETHAAIVDTEQLIADNQVDTVKETEKLRALKAKYDEIRDWSAAFEHLRGDAQRMVLSRIIKRITIDRNYNLEVEFYITQEEFEGNAEQENPLISDEKLPLESCRIAEYRPSTQ